MRISAKGEYAIRAVLDLALHHGQGRVPIQEIARRQGIPQRYLEQLLLVLRRAGILESKRGSTGGYQLLRPPAGLSVGEVLRAVEGRVQALDVAGRPAGDGLGPASDLEPLWQEIAGAVAAVIDRITIADLVEWVQARRSPERAVYHI
jgi:Rrf2 family cysteine metabolism transcriptional repressor